MQRGGEGEGVRVGVAVARNGCLLQLVARGGAVAAAAGAAPAARTATATSTGTTPSFSSSSAPVARSPSVTAPMSSSGWRTTGSAFRVVARSGSGTGPVAANTTSAASMSTLAAGVKVTEKGTERPAERRPGGVCATEKRSRSAGGSSSKRNELKEKEELVSVAWRVMGTPTWKSLNSSSGGSQMKPAPEKARPAATCGRAMLARARKRRGGEARLVL